MALSIVVCVKQVVDPEMPPSAFRVDPERRRVIPAEGLPPVVNGFDENAVEAALRIKDTTGASVSVLSVGHGFVLDVMKKPLAMGADGLVLVDDPAVADLDAYATALVLARAIQKLGSFDLVLCGRQASDWDNAHVPMGVAEMLGLPCITVAQKVEVVGGIVVVERNLTDAYEVVEAPLPSLVTVSNELGEPRYPTLRGIMAASRKSPTVWSAAEVGVFDPGAECKVRVTELSVPVSERRCELITGDDDTDAGRKLALRLREAKLL